MLIKIKKIGEGAGGKGIVRKYTEGGMNAFMVAKEGDGGC